MQVTSPSERKGFRLFAYTVRLAFQRAWANLLLLLLAIGPLRKVRTDSYKGELGAVWEFIIAGGIMLRALLTGLTGVGSFLLSPIWVPALVAYGFWKRRKKLQEINAEVAGG